jgi:cytoskeletal protein CcmA (bactofilin family)
MFNTNKKGMGKSNESESFQRNQVAKGTTITGDIETNGSIRIDGELTGTIKSSGKVVIGETGKVNGEIICQTANCSGNVKGKITVTELLTLHSTASIKGDIITGKLAIEPGATFTGNCSMGAVIKEMSHDKKGSKQKQA